MQITTDKCQGRGEGCLDPDFNIMTAARYFKSELDNHGQALLPALGAYNGWQAYSMTVNSATAAGELSFGGHESVPSRSPPLDFKTDSARVF
jgi:soluble lytic murein transglycosylase-like protein